MVQFNPQTPTPGDPNYLGYSKPISQPSADLSLASVFKGIGDTFEAGVKGVDTFVKDYINSEVENKVGTEQDKYITALEDTSRTGKSVSKGIPDGNPMSLLPDNVEAPDSLNNGLRDIEDLHNAHTTRGKPGYTYYTSKIYSIAKELRNSFPGYRDYIDTEISKITGFKPANAYINAIAQDLSNAGQGAIDTRKRALALLEKHIGELGAPVLLDRVMNSAGPDEEQAYKDVFTWAATVEAQNAQRAREKDIIENRKLRNEDTDRIDIRNATRIVREEASNFVSSVKLGSGIRTISDLQDIIRQHNQGTKILSQEDINRIGEVLSSARSTLYTRSRQKLIEQGYSFDGKTMNEIINNELAFLDDISKSISEKRFAAADSYTRFQKAQIDDTTRALFANKKFGAFARMMKVAQDMGPQVAEKMFQSYLVDDPDVVAGYRSFMDWYKLQSFTGRNILQPGEPQPSFTKAIEDAQSNEIHAPKVYSDLVNHINNLTNPEVSDEGKVNLARWYFDPINGKTIQKFQKDYKDSQGRTIPGRISIFNRFTSSDKAAEIMRLSEKDPDLKRMYLNWVDNNFGNVLFRDALKDLNEVTDFNGIHLAWDNKNYRWNVYADKLSIQARRAGIRENPNLRIVNDRISDLNLGLQGMANVAKVAGVDPNVYLFQKMVQFGFDPTTKGIENIPQRMLDSLQNTSQSPINGRTFDKTTKGSPSTPEQLKNQTEPVVPEFNEYAEAVRPPSLKEWLNNPDGSPTPVFSQNLSDSQILGIDVQDIPDGMSAKDFLNKLKKLKK